MSYSDLLKDPRWQKKRLTILNRDEWLCTMCGNGQITLHVHHKKYIRGLKPWEYEDHYLTTLCVECHKIASEGMNEAVQSIGDAVRFAGFMPGSIREMAEAFESIELLHGEFYVASAISFWLSSPELQKEMVDRYYIHLYQE